MSKYLVCLNISVLFFLSVLQSCNPSFRVNPEVSEKVFSKIKTGGRFTCGITNTNQFYCWGQNTRGQIGNSQSGVGLAVTSPEKINTSNFSSGEFVKDFSLGYRSACAITNVNKAYCWGEFLGPAGPEIVIPTMVDFSILDPGELLLKIYTAGSHACVLTSLNRAFCWGSNASGQLGVAVPVTSTATPIIINMGALGATEFFSDLGLGYLHSCGVTNLKNIYCWGLNNFRQIGNGTATASYSQPTLVDLSAVAPTDVVSELYVGYYNGCFITQQKMTYCWGSNNFGQMGLGDSGVNYDVPTLMSDFSMPNNYFKNISVGFYYSCGVSNLGKIYCWGRNQNGQLGNNSILNSDVPTEIDVSGIPSDTLFKSVHVGDYHSCGLSVKNLLYCWGSNIEGQMANTDGGASLIPMKINLSILNLN